MKGLNMESKEKEYKEHTKFVWDRYVMENRELRAVEKVVLAEVVALHTQGNGCFKSNDALAIIGGITNRGIQKVIKGLKDKGYLYEPTQIRSEANLTIRRILEPNISFAKIRYVELLREAKEKAKEKEISKEVIESPRTSEQFTTNSLTSQDELLYSSPRPLGRTENTIEYNKNTYSNKEGEKEVSKESSSIGGILKQPNNKEVSKEDVFSYLEGTIKATSYEERYKHESIPTSDDIDPLDYDDKSKAGFHYGRKYNGDEIKQGDKVYVANQGISQHNLHNYIS